VSVSLVHDSLLHYVYRWRVSARYKPYMFVPDAHSL
jgi:hypothetical protein